MSKLTELLQDLGGDSTLAAAYENDPESVMQRYQLSQEEVQAMLAKDVEKLKRLSGLDNLKSNGNVQSYDP